MSEFLEQLGIEDMDPTAKDDLQPLYGTQEDPGTEVLSEPVYEDSAVEAVVPGMSEVEKRLQKAVLYQQWASGNLYDQKTASTVEVETEFRDFALSQLNKLIGIQQDVKEVVVKSDFDAAEVAALKGLAQMVIKNPALVGGKKPVQETAKPAPKPQPKIEQRKIEVAVVAKPVVKPKLRRQEVPQEIAQTPPVVRQAVAPVVQHPQVQQSVAPSVGQNRNARGPQFYQDGAVVEENGKKYGIKWVQTNAEAYGPAEEIRLNNMKPKTCLLLKDGMTVYKTEGDEYFKIVKMDKTPKARPVEAVPFPSNMTLATMSAAELGANAVNNRFIGSIRR